VRTLIAKGLLLAVLSVHSQAQAGVLSRIFGKENAAEVPAGAIQFEASLTKAGLPENLNRAMDAASVLVRGSGTPVQGSPELLNRARGDYRRLLAVLYNFGYYSPSISIRLNGQEASEIPLSAQFSSPVKVDVSVSPGPEFRFGTVSIGPLVSTLSENTAFQKGQVARADVISAAGQNAIQAWRSKGYALARITKRSATANHDQSLLDVAIEIDPGPLMSIGAISVDGTDRVDEDFVLYLSDLHRTDRFDPADLELARKRLIRSGAFKSVQIHEGEPPNRSTELPLALQVSESPRRKFGFGASVSSSDGAKLEGYWMHRNLFGRAERLRFDASIEGLGARGSPGNFDYSLGATFIKPGVFTPDTNLTLSATTERNVINSIDTRNVNLDVGLVRHLPDYSLGLSGFTTYSQTQDTGGFRSFHLLGLRFEGTRDQRTNVLDPQGGYFAQARLTPFREYAFGNTALRTEFELRAYRSIGASDNAVLAGRFFVGSLAGVSLAQSPTDMLFFSGGGGSVRGYDFNSRGVTTGGVFSGGRSVINFSGEFRYRLNDTFGVVGFADMGLVGQGALPDPSIGLHIGIGAGLRYYTSLGPIRIDIARGVNRQAGDPAFALYLGLGQAF
jgi:translocation and assembly module TamA